MWVDWCRGGHSASTLYTFTQYWVRTWDHVCSNFNNPTPVWVISKQIGPYRNVKKKSLWRVLKYISHICTVHHYGHTNIIERNSVGNNAFQMCEIFTTFNDTDFRWISASKCGGFWLKFGKSASGCQLMYRFRTELYFSQQTWIQYMWINSGMLLQVLTSTAITSWPGTSSCLGSTADCGCLGRLWCQHHGSQTYVLKIHCRGCKTTLGLFYAVLQVTGSNRKTWVRRFHYQPCGKKYGTLRTR